MPHVSTASDSWHRESERHGMTNDKLERLRAHQPAYLEVDPEPTPEPVSYQESDDERRRWRQEQKEHMYAMLRAPMTDEELVSFMEKSPKYAAYKESLGI